FSTQNHSVQSQQSLALLWLGLILTITFRIAFAQPTPPNDYWGYVRLGEEIVATGTLPEGDTFSYTQYGQPMVYHSWLAAVIFAWLYSWGGIPVAVLVKGVLLTIFYGSVWQVCRLAGAGPRLASLGMLLTVLTSCNNWV